MLDDLLEGHVEAAAAMGLPLPQWSHGGRAPGPYVALGARGAAGRTAGGGKAEAGAEAGAEVEVKAKAYAETRAGAEAEAEVEAEAGEGEGGGLSAVHHQQALLP